MILLSMGHGQNMENKEKEQKSAPKADFSQNNTQTANDTYTPGDEIFENLPPMDFLGGIPADFQIEKGVTAKEARNFVISNCNSNYELQEKRF